MSTLSVSLKRAGVADAETIWRMQIASFGDLLRKYRDYDTNPGNESLDRIRARLEQPRTYFYFIMLEDVPVGAIRVVDAHDAGQKKRISPLFILPEYRGRGLAQRAIAMAEAIHGAHGWRLNTILQEAGNCHLYEKMGYRQTGETRAVNDRMTLVVYEKD